MKEIKEIDFNKSVIEYNKETKRPFILFFYSNNCSYCYKVENILNLLEKDYGKEISFFRINTTYNENIVNNYYIKATPTVLIFDSESFLKQRGMGNQITFEELKKELSLLYEEDNFLKKIFMKIKGS